jgi:hypothetical protein
MIFEKYFKHPFMDADTGSTGMAANEGEVAELQQENGNTGDEGNVDNGQSTEPTEPNNEPNQPQQQQEPQDITQTQAFSRRLNEMVQKAIDAEYDRLYGQEYGIHSKADYDAYVARQKAIEEGKDPEVVDLRNDLSKTQAELQELRFEKLLIEQRERLQQDPFFKEWEPEINEKMKLFDELYRTGQIPNRVDLETALTLMWKEKGPQEIAKLKQKFEIDQSNKINAASGTGSVVGNGAVPQGFISKETFEMNKNNMKWVMDNLEQLEKDSKKW